MSRREPNNGDNPVHYFNVLDAQVETYVNNWLTVFIEMWIPPQLWARIYAIDMQSLHDLVHLQRIQGFLPPMPNEDQERHIKKRIRTATAFGWLFNTSNTFYVKIIMPS